MSNTDRKTTFSIVAAVHDQAQELREHLPTLLAQQYEAGYEVIVVDESSTDETADVLKQLKAEYPHLYTTFLPKYQFQTNRLRLALTIGVKAAKNNWLIFTDICTPPPYDGWLDELAAQTSRSTMLTLGYINRKTGDLLLQPFDSIDEARTHISNTERHQSGKGHKGKHLRYLRGKYDFMAVRREEGHEALRQFGDNLRSRQLLTQSIRVALYNLMHK